MENNNSIYIDIFKEIRTKSDSRKLLDQIDNFSLTLFQIKHKTNLETLRDIFGEKYTDIFINNIKKGENEEIINSQLQLYFRSLSDLIIQSHTAQLTLSIEPERDLIINISEKLREYFNSATLLLDIKVNKGIIGGSQIIYNGKYLDLTLNKRIDDFFLMHNEKVRF